MLFKLLLSKKKKKEKLQKSCRDGKIIHLLFNQVFYLIWYFYLLADVSWFPV